MKIAATLLLLCSGCFDYGRLSAGLELADGGHGVDGAKMDQFEDGGADDLAKLTDGGTGQFDGAPPSTCDGGPLIEHDNGAGQKFYSCNPVGSHLQSDAFRACAAFGGVAPQWPCVVTLCGTIDRVVCVSADKITYAQWWPDEATTAPSGSVRVGTGGCDCSYTPTGTWN